MKKLNPSTYKSFFCNNIRHLESFYYDRLRQSKGNNSRPLRADMVKA